MDKDRDFLWIFISFFAAFIIYRVLPFNVESMLQWEPRGIHVHHFVFGMAGLALTGYLAIMGYRLCGLLPMAYGYFLFLAVDQSAMWLKMISDDKDDPLEYVGNAVVMVVLLYLLIIRIKKLR